jgi:hypothetical protein
VDVKALGIVDVPRVIEILFINNYVALLVWERKKED